MGSQEAIKAMLGTAAPTEQTKMSGQGTEAPALKSIATNGALLVQNVSQLSATLRRITTAWGA